MTADEIAETEQRLRQMRDVIVDHLEVLEECRSDISMTWRAAEYRAESAANVAREALAEIQHLIRQLRILRSIDAKTLLLLEREQ